MSSLNVSRILCCAALLILSGCTAGVVQTSQQLDGGELVASVAGELPGAYGIPRASANLAYGIAGVGDINLHAGTTLLTMGAGAGLRVYPTDLITVSAQGSYNLFGYLGEQELAGLLTGSARVTTSTTHKRMLYGGLEVLAIGANGNLQDLDFDVSNDNDPASLTYLQTSLGLVFGVESALDNGNTAQAELVFRPLTCRPGDSCGLFPFNEDGNTYYLIQLSAAVHFRFFADEPAAVPTPPPVSAE